MYPPIGPAMAMVGMDEIGVYIALHHNKVAQYIATCPIMDLYLAEEQNPGLHLSRQCWEQTALGILGIILGHAAAEGGGGERQGRINQREREIRIAKGGGKEK